MKSMNWKTLLTEPVLAGNEMWRIGGLFLAILAALMAGRIARALLLRAAERLKKSHRRVAAVAGEALAATSTFLFLTLGLELGFRCLAMSDKIAGMVDTGVNVLLVLAVAWLVYRLVDVVDFWMRHETGQTVSRLDDMLVPLVRKSLRVTIVILALLQVATILSDKPVTSLLAGLGVGGLAMALAAQETIKNFFGSIVLFADKPFEMGDRIVVDGFDGTVEEVGFRSTRLRTLEGNLVTLPNGELANKNIQNIGKRPFIRRILNIALPYDTPPAKVQKAVEILKDILKDHEGMRPDYPPRVVFNEFNASSLNVQVLYWYYPPEYWAFMAFSERANLQILDRFGREGIEFAFPTQALVIAGDPKRPMQRPEPVSNRAPTPGTG